MGQYYKGVIFTKSSRKQKNNKIKMAFDCYVHGNGAKLTEHSYVGNSYVRAYEVMLSGKYYGYPFVWVGDYADSHNGEDVYSLAHNFIENRMAINAKKRGYKLVNNRFVKYDRDGYETYGQSDDFYDHIENDREVEYRYILNFDKKCFIRIPAISNKLTFHPLPLLCADGNGGGGGDYWGKNEELVGLWAYDRIGIGNEVPSDFKTELVATFLESYEGGKGSDYEYREL